jgi:hypothetical protein
MKLVAAFLASIALAVQAFAANYWQVHFDNRLAIISQQNGLLGTGDVVIYGDSNTEAFWWNTVANCHLVNAGFGGARIRDLAIMAPQIAGMTKPKLVHIMVGTNNIDHGFIASAGYAAERATVVQDMQTIISAFKAQGSKVVVWPVPPASASFGNSAERDALNAAFYPLTSISNNIFWDWWWPNTFTNAAPAVGGTVASGAPTSGSMLGDGVHVSPAVQASRLARMQVWQNYTGTSC